MRRLFISIGIAKHVAVTPRPARDLEAERNGRKAQVDLLVVNDAEDLQAARWEKLVWNIPYNGLSVVLDATTAELMADPHTRAAVEDLMCEVAVGAQACGHPLASRAQRDLMEYVSHSGERFSVTGTRSRH